MKKLVLGLAFAALLLVGISLFALFTFTHSVSPASTTTIGDNNSNANAVDIVADDSTLTDANLDSGDTLAYESKHTTCARRWAWYEEHTGY